MNKNDIANIRKQFKLNNDLMKIREIFNVYVQKESGEIYHHISQPFEMLEQEAQELFLQNFKKVLTGNLDTKLFELKFRYEVEDSTQNILFQGLHVGSSDWQENMLQIVDKMFAHTVYEFDTVVTFIRGEYQKPTRKRDPESEVGGNDEVYSSHFILCSVNKTDQPKKALLFDYIEKEFKSNNAVDPIINLASPLSGFLFPAFNDNSADVNHILYCAGKVNQPDVTFVEEVLNCEETITAAEDKDCFELILNKVIGDVVDSTVISNVYEEIDKIVQESKEDKEESEEPLLDYKDVERILTVSGVEDVNTAKVEHAFKTVVADEKHEFKASSVVPKSIKIETKVANVSISPTDLKYVKYITYDGKRCLLLEIDEDVVVEGFRLESETL
jgi:microcompartment protein CcmL/EutN